MDKEEKISRLRTAFEYLRFKGIIHTQADVAARMNAAEVTISRAFNGNEKYLTVKFLRRFNNAFNNIFNFEWLINGTGTMLDDASDKNMETNVERIILPKKASTEESNLQTRNGVKYYSQGSGKYIIRVPLIPYEAYAKFASRSEQQNDRNDWEEVDFEVDTIGRGNYMAFTVRGDSMDDGTRRSFAQDEIVLVRELDHIYWKDGLRINRYPYWVIAFDNTILLKEVIYQNIEIGEITCHSINPSPEYRDFTINMDKIQRLFNVVKKKTPDTTY